MKLWIGHLLEHQEQKLKVLISQLGTGPMKLTMDWSLARAPRTKAKGFN